MSESLQLGKHTFILDKYGSDFLLIKEEAGLVELPKLGEQILNSSLDFIDEVIATESEICLKLNDLYKDDSLKALSELQYQENKSINAYTLPVYIDTEVEDWKAIETHTGLTREIYLDKLLTVELQMAMYGFLPGFLYITGLPKELQVPRKATPEKHLAPGSLAIGGPYLGLYSLPSPGGWNVLGRCPIKVFDGSELPPLEVKLGDTLRLQLISEKTYQALLSNPLTLKEYNGLL